MEITRQAEYYGLPEPPRAPAPPPEKVADLLAAPIPWSGPLKVGKLTPEEIAEKERETEDLYRQQEKNTGVYIPPPERRPYPGSFGKHGDPLLGAGER